VANIIGPAAASEAAGHAVELSHPRFFCSSDMPDRAANLYGSAPDKSSVALILIDVINDLAFPEGEQLLEQALPMARRIAALKRCAAEAGVPVIYVNDNFGRWRSDFRAQFEHTLKDGTLGRPVVELLPPGDDDYFVLKPKHSGFFSTTLDILLEYLGVRSVVLTGIATNICVLFTANDAYMRDLSLFVPSDCVAANTEDDNKYALEQMRTILKADIRASSDLNLSAIKKSASADISG
jgi:nicotinamidase-related amidase